MLNRLRLRSQVYGFSKLLFDQVVVNAMRELEGQPALSTQELVEIGAIEYIPFPEALVGKYQSFTQADISSLRAAGYDAPFL